MRVADEKHLERPWLIHGLLDDFGLEDVWALDDITGSVDDFEEAVALFAESDPSNASHLPTRLLWRARDALGRRFGLGSITDGVDGGGDLPIPGTYDTTLATRLPDHLRGSAADVRFEHLPFVPLYRTRDEFVAEISNRTVHGVLHLGWVPQPGATVGGGGYRGEMAVYVKPRGRFGSAYMRFIQPFRYLVVYPALERQLAKTWARRPAGPAH